MIRKFTTAFCMIFLLGVGSANAFTFTIGDVDEFANQSTAEAAATNGAQFTDKSSSGRGAIETVVPITFNFAPFSVITSATFTVRSRGIQSNDTNPSTFSLGEDGLTLDGALVSEFFAGVNPGQFGTATTTGSLNSSLFAALADGSAVFTILMNSFAGTGVANGEPVAFDFFELNIEGTLANTSVVPVPAALPLFAGGLGLMGLVGWRRKRITAARA